MNKGRSELKTLDRENEITDSAIEGLKDGLNTLSNLKKLTIDLM